MKVYVLMVSQFFPAVHAKAGQQTGFPLAIKHCEKIHTIRGSYQLWEKRIQNIIEGKAILSVRIWSDKPYRSTQQEIFKFDHTHKIGIEKLNYSELAWVINDAPLKAIKTETLAKNDCLSLPDFIDWFKGEFNVTKTKAIIHFTDFRYSLNF